MKKFLIDKTILIFCAFLIFSVLIWFLTTDNYLPSRLKYEIGKLSPNQNFVQISDDWKNYSLSNISFQAPDNFRVNIIDKYRASVTPETKFNDLGINIDSGVYRYLRSYQDAINFYKHSDKIKIYELKELSNDKARITGQRYECTGWCYWTNFEHILANINNNAVLLELVRLTGATQSIDSRTIDKIVSSIKPVE